MLIERTTRIAFNGVTEKVFPVYRVIDGDMIIEVDAKVADSTPNPIEFCKAEFALYKEIR